MEELGSEVNNAEASGKKNGSSTDTSGDMNMSGETIEELVEAELKMELLWKKKIRVEKLLALYKLQAEIRAFLQGMGVDSL